MITSLPTWIKVWFLITVPIIAWDASFVMLRPHSMKGGSLEIFWKPYQTYVEADKRYQDLNDGFVIAQSYMNMVETIIAFASVIASNKRNPICHLLAFSAALMTLAKTVL
eukprot:TRINITY_DN2423_c0_g1_i1.p1 TRINITY_DN2423_c0_g1~~TRINITY_DN2423_c0_g1_i1.p1  ORF type:complete len:110 (+),score=16.38 TRINITY_DN2423_c0_g1_i1:66-395(+)